MISIAALPVVCSMASSTAHILFQWCSISALPKTTALRKCVVNVLGMTSSAAITQREAFA
jgi:hypothetical protein